MGGHSSFPQLYLSRPAAAQFRSFSAIRVVGKVRLTDTPLTSPIVGLAWLPIGLIDCLAMVVCVLATTG